MAAHDYYSSGWSSQHHAHDAPLPPLPPGSQSSSGPTNIATPASSSSSPFDDHSYAYPHHAQDSQQSLGLETDYYGKHGKTQEFADDIPLKTQQQSNPYSPGPEDRLPGPVAAEDGGRKRRSKSRTKRRIPWFVYAITTIQIGVFIGEVIKNIVLTKLPIAIRPQFNPMIGPSPYVLINMGARFVPCMRFTPGTQNVTWPCPNITSSDPNSPSLSCHLPDLCGFGATQTQPNQWFRFILPMFLHAGLIHIGFNMLLQMTLGKDMEQTIGPLRFALVYLSSGIFGFVLGGNFAPDGISSTGASGALFGILALVLLDILYTWGERKSPRKDLAFIALDVVISFVLGLLPGLDNFSHIGGFMMGLGLGLFVLRSPTALRQRIGDEPPYAPVKPSDGVLGGIAKKPVGFFKGRKPLWWAWWLLRAAALVAVLIGFIVLLNNFYKYRVKCSWCKHLSCLSARDDISSTQAVHYPQMATLGTPSPPLSPSYKHRQRNFARHCERACCSLVTYFPLAFVYGLTSWGVWVESSIGLKTMKEKSVWRGLLISLLGISLYLLANVSYTTAVFTDPGSPLTAANGYSHLPTHEAPSTASFTVKSTGSTRYCKKCQFAKPDRTHHCSTCRRCVLKMDHHCPWLATCLGLRNYKAFVLFLVYTSIFCWVCFAVTADWVWGNVFSDGQFADTLMPVNYVLLAVVSGIIGLVLTGFTGWHLSLILKNQTTIECLERVRYLSPLQKSSQNQQRYQQNYINRSYPSPNYDQQLRKIHTDTPAGVSLGEEGEDRPLQADSQPTLALASLHRNYNDLERERERDRYESYLEEKFMEKLPNAFDLGWRANLRHLFGPNPWLWCLPACNSTGDGWNWEPSTKWLEARDALLREQEEESRLQEERERRAGWGGPGISMERTSSWGGHSGTLVPETSASWPSREERAERHYLTTPVGVASLPVSGGRPPSKADQVLGRHSGQHADYLDDDQAHSDSGMSMRTLRSPRDTRRRGYDGDGDGNEFADAYEGSSHEDADVHADEQGVREDRILRRNGRGWIRSKAISTTGHTAENQKLLGREGVSGVEDEWRDWE